MKHRMQHRWRLLVAAAAAVALAVAGCADSSLDPDREHSDGVIRIGLVWPTSGVYKTIGDDLARGWQLYLDSHGGKLGGHRVQTVVVDEGNGRELVRPGIKKLIEQDKVDVVVGTITSDAVEVIHPETTRKKIPYVATGGRPTTISDVTWTWHTSWQNKDAGNAIADLLRTTVNGPVYAIGPDYIGGKDQVNGFVEPFVKAGGKLANPDGAPLWTPYPNTTNFLPYLNAIAASPAKAVFAFYGGGLGVEFVKQYAQAGLKDKLPLYAAGFTTEGAVLQAQGAAADGIYTSLNYAPDLDNAPNRAFATAFQRKHQTVPDLYNVTAWDAALLLDRAIADAGDTPTSASINAAIGRLGAIDSPRGPWRFGAKEHSPIQTWYLRQVRADGRGRANVVVQTLTTLGQ
ncbi:ABC transporter substrate-binding protein [Phytohabitans houttuyneae]|uniref:ABC transporter substrate-binding protein n=2 Tax=Phytohabitans houttuyneae TaxID=1076126 RepID=A0A6V8KHV0_9ACTN|nr:ABC transporter substrate-binding protein [Phytohabitans houttuyneae]GFJ82041.1 ABC transporter substrate-binding protein [Phytohabitans houttuyneae]